MARLAAGIRKRKDGTLEKRFTVDGKRYSIYGKNSKEIAEKEQTARKAIAEGAYRNNKNITLDRYFQEWVTHKKNSTKANTLHVYSNYFSNHISPKLGQKKICKIEKREVIDLQTETAKTLSVVSCNYVLKILRLVLNDAVNDEIITRNPAADVKPMKNTAEKANKTIHRALTEEEQRQFMDEIKSDPYYEFVAMMLCTGMRCGEVAALEWGDVDYIGNVLHITKSTTVAADGKYTVGTPKTAASVREIPITASIREILRLQRNKQKNVATMGKKRVFDSVYEEIVRPVQVNRAINKALERLDQKGIYIEHFSCHAMRDTFATRYIEQGGQPQTLKTILGHSSLAMTMDLYSQVLPNTRQQEMDSLQIAF